MEKIAQVNVERRRQRVAWSLFALVFLVLVGSFAFFHIRYARGIGKHLQELKAANEPVTLEEITREYRSLKADQNGAAAYSNAFVLMTNVALLGERKATEIKVDATKLLDGNRETYEQVYRENETFYAAMRDATAKFRQTTYPLKFEEGLAMLLKHLKENGDAFKLIELNALFAAEEKDTARLMRDLEMMLTLANSVEREPTMISALVRLRGITMAARITQLVVQSEKLSDAQFKRLRALWNFPPVREHFARSLAMERWVVRDLFTRPSAYFWSVIDEKDGAGMNLIWQFYKISGRAKADELNHMKKIRELQILMVQPPSHEQYDAVQSFVAQLEQERAKGVRRLKLVSGMFLPGVYKASERVIRAEATVNLVKLGLNVAEDYRAKRKFPAELQNVSGATNQLATIDPFTGSEFMYVVEDDGALIYSVGPNGIDERGVTFEKGKVDDFGFHVGHAR